MIFAAVIPFAAAGIPSKTTGAILDLRRILGFCKAICTDFIAYALQKRLRCPKFDYPEQIVKDVLNEIDGHGIYVDAEHVDVELPDPKDLVFY